MGVGEKEGASDASAVGAADIDGRCVGAFDGIALSSSSIEEQAVVTSKFEHPPSSKIFTTSTNGALLSGSDEEDKPYLR